MEAELYICEALYELFADELKEREARGRAEGVAQGVAQGKIQGRIQSLIETCAELGVTRESTLKRLMDKLALTQDAAEIYMEKYWIH